VKDRVRAADRFAAQYAVGGGKFAIAERREHQRQFTGRDRPGGRRQVDVLRSFCREEADGTRQEFADFLAQGEPRPRLVDNCRDALLERVQIVGGDGDGDLHQVEGIAVVDFLKGAAAVSHALHRTTVLATHARQMHLVRLDDAFHGIDGGVAVIGLGDVHRQRQREIEPQQRRQGTEEIPRRGCEFIAGQHRPNGSPAGTTGRRQMPEGTILQFIASLEQRRKRAFGHRCVKRG